MLCLTTPSQAGATVNLCMVRRPPGPWRPSVIKLAYKGLLGCIFGTVVRHHNKDDVSCQEALEHLCD